MDTGYEAFLDSVTCEEYYDENYEMWLEEIHIDTVNLELQLISEEAREVF